MTAGAHDRLMYILSGAWMARYSQMIFLVTITIIMVFFWAWPHVAIEDKDYDLWIEDEIHNEFVRWLARESGPYAAILGVENGWFVNSQKVMIERIWLHVFPADSYSQDINLRITWVPVIPRISLVGAPKKSYGGVSLRFNVDLQSQPNVVTIPTGRTQGGKGIRLPWVDMTANFPKSITIMTDKSSHIHAALENNRVRSGMTIFVPPDHPDFPPTWLIRTYGPICIGWPGLTWRAFSADEPFTLAYRLRIHKGDVDTKFLSNIYDDYTAGCSHSRWKKEAESETLSWKAKFGFIP